MTTTMEDTRTDDAVLDQTVTSDDPGKATHIVPVPADLADKFDTPQAYVMAARIEGFEVQALCGYVFVVQQDPSSFPVCQRCYDLYMQGADKWGDRDKLPDA